MEVEENEVTESITPGLSYLNRTQQWVATYKGQRVTYSERRFGAGAKRLAERALLAMQGGTYNEVRDNVVFKQSYDIDLAAKSLNIQVWELRRWLLNGVIRGKEITPPRRDTGKGADKFSGYELILAREALQGITW
ncbi:hypothetical protein HNP12_000617 [Aeromonas hydrophila]|uniref:hypothetical protein n=1 Tax=Aeromonas hydrophila TaxID=644 RepID=UPI002167CC6A|nr:hypothetical protein [Aeromonas hydrophila]MCS3766569.1 hypothetical protein [Aeromonas hydrophila]